MLALISSPPYCWYCLPPVTELSCQKVKHILQNMPINSYDKICQNEPLMLHIFRKIPFNILLMHCFCMCHPLWVIYWTNNIHLISSALLFFCLKPQLCESSFNISRFYPVANSVHCPDRNSRCLSWQVKGSKCEKAYKGIFVSIWNNRSTIVWQGCSCNKPPPLHIKVDDTMTPGCLDWTDCLCSPPQDVIEWKNVLVDLTV